MKTKQLRHLGPGIVVLLAGLTVVPRSPAGVPAWWIHSGVLNTNVAPNDYAVVNQGQVKNIAVQAAADMATNLPNGAGSAVADLLSHFSTTNNYVPANIGQIKYVAKLFYDRLIEVGYTNAYPWTTSPADDADFALGNVGQLKYVFSWDLSRLPRPFSVTGGGSFCSGGSGVAVGLSGSQSGANYQLKLDGSNTGSPVAGTGAAISFGNQTIGGTYTVVATKTATGCSLTMAGGATVTVIALPTPFSVTGGGSYCSGGSGVAVGLSGSQNGVNYQLKLNGSNSGSPAAGTGSAISFGNQTTAGTYTVLATNTATGCTVTASGSATVTVNALPTVFTMTGGGTFCSGGSGVAVGLSGSQSGVNYQLKLNGSNSGSPVAGTGSAISFGNQTIGGTYTVVATNTATGCTVTANGSATVTVNALPTVFTVTGGGTFCSGGSGVAVGLSGSQSGVNYQLKLNGSNSGSPVAGTGSAISFGNQTTTGTYTVAAANPTTSCSMAMTNSVTVSTNRPPQITAGPTNLLVWTTGSATFSVTASGTPPLTYQWQKNSASISAATSTTLILSNLGTLDTGTYGVVVSNNCGTATASATLTVTNAAVTINLTSGKLDYMLGRPPTPLDKGASITVTGTVNSGYFSNKTLAVAFTLSQSNDYLSVRNAGSKANQLRISGKLNSDNTRDITNIVNTTTNQIGTCKGGTPQEPLLVTFNTNATVSSVTTVLTNISYYNTSSTPVASTRQVCMLFSNSTATPISPTATVTITSKCPDSIDVILIIDKTGSMIDNHDVADAPGKTRLDVAKAAATNFVNYLKFPDDSVSVIAFPRYFPPSQQDDTNAANTFVQETDPVFVTSYDTATNTIWGINDAGGGTIYLSALQAADADFTNLYQSLTYDTNVLELVIFLTDGRMLEGGPCNTPTCTNRYFGGSIDEARLLSERGARVLTIGFAGVFDSSGSNLLQCMASSWPQTNDCLIAPTRAALQTKYTEIAGGVCRNRIRFTIPSLTYTENDPATILDQNFVVNDPASVNYDQNVLTFSLSPNNLTEDQLAIRNQGTGSGQISVSGSTIGYGTGSGTANIGTFTGQGTRTITVTLNGTATMAGVAAVARNITYSNISDNPSTANRTVTAIITDASTVASPATSMDIVVVPVNDAPTLTTVATLDEAVQDTAFAISYTTLHDASDVNDVDSSPIYFRVESVTSGALTKGGAAVTPGTTTLGPDETWAWTPAAGASGPGLNAFTVRAWDGALASATSVQVRVNVTPVNNPLVVSAGPDQTIVLPTTCILTGSVNGGTAPVVVDGWTKISGPGMATFSPNTTALMPQVAFSQPGFYQFQFQAHDHTGATATDVMQVHVLANHPPVVDAGPDRIIGRTSGVQTHLTGTVSDDGLPVGSTLSITWSKEPGNPSLNVAISQDPDHLTDPAKAIATFTHDSGHTEVTAGIYKFKLTANDGTGDQSNEMTVTVVDLRGQTYTRNADFAEGSLLNVNYDEMPDELRLNRKVTPYPYVNIACSSRGTVARIDVNTGQVVGEYPTSPNTGRSPSRTTVDKYGNVWVGNRYDDDANNDGTGRGSIARIGLIIGGMRTDGSMEGGKYKFVANGDYLAPPYLYNTCKDKDGDGLIKTSRGLGNTLPWGQDEAVDYYTMLGTGIRTMAIDQDNNLWTGGNDNGTYEEMNTATGVSQWKFNSYGGYGGLVDQKGNLWSSLQGAGLLLKYNTIAQGDPQTFNATGIYGIGIDPLTGNIWYSVNGSDEHSKYNAHVRNPQDGSELGSYYEGGSGGGRGIAVDSKSNVWVALSGQGVGHLRTDGTFVGTLVLPCASETIGVAVDLNGKIWAANGNGKAYRINPDGGPIKGGGFYLGYTDMIVDLHTNSEAEPGPYNYSDMTGFVSLGATAPSGSWDVTHDGTQNDLPWKVSWTATNNVDKGAIVRVEARATNTVAALAVRPFLPVLVSGDTLTNAPGVNEKGRYIEVRVTFLRGEEPPQDPAAETQVTPSLQDLTVTPDVDVVTAENPHTIAQDDQFTVSENGGENTTNPLHVLANDHIPPGATLTVTGLSSAQNGTAWVEDGQLVQYVPRPGFYGIDRIVYTVTDGADAIDHGLVTVKVLRTNPKIYPPQATNDTFTINGVINGMNTYQDFDVLANDVSFQPGPNGGTITDSKSIIDVSNPLHGSAQISGCSDRVRYLPVRGFHGVDQFTYTIVNSKGLTDTAQVTVNVREAGTISCNGSVSGALSSDHVLGPGGAYVDVYEFSGQKDQRVVISMAPSSGSTLPTYFYLVDPSGNTVASDSSLLTNDLAQTGVYTIQATSDWGNPPPTGGYQLQLGCPTPAILKVTIGSTPVMEEIWVNLGTISAGGGSFTRSVTIANTGGSPLQISGAQVFDTPYQLNWSGSAPTPAAPLVIQPNASDSTSLQVQFNTPGSVPYDQGYYTWLEIDYSDDGGRQTKYFYVGLEEFVSSTSHDAIWMESPIYDGSLFEPCSSIPLVAGLYKPSIRSVSKVEFYSNYNGETLISQATASGGKYVYTWSDATKPQDSTDTYWPYVFARATFTDNSTIDSDRIPIPINDLVQMAGPVTTPSSPVPLGNVVLKATAATGAGATIDKVEFFDETDQNRGVKIGEQSTGPQGVYLINWTPPYEGTFYIMATASVHKTSNSAVKWVTKTGWFTVYVGPPMVTNKPPIAANDQYAIYGNTSYNLLNVTANDSDPDGYDFQIIGAPSVTEKGWVSISTDGKSLYYTPRIKGISDFGGLGKILFPEPGGEQCSCLQDPDIARYFGTDSFTYTIQDAKGGRAQALVEVNIGYFNPPTVTINKINGNPMTTTSTNLPWDQTSATVEVGFSSALAQLQLLADSDTIIGTMLAPANPATFTWNRIPAGTHYLRARAVDTIGDVGYSAIIQVIKAAKPGNHPPIAVITNPVETPNGSPDGLPHLPIVENKVTPSGTAADSDVSPQDTVTWQFFLYGSDGTPLGSLTSETQSRVTAGNFPALDLGRFPDGVYTLELRVSDGWDVSTASVRFVLRNPLKIGRFTFSQEDLLIPGIGLPLSVARTYDSYNPTVGDFGYGWTWALNDLHVELDEDRADYEDFYSSDSESFSMRVDGGRDVTLTLPDGRRTTFTYRLVSRNYNGFGAYDAVWDPEPGVTATLTTLNPGVPGDSGTPGDNTLLTEPWPNWDHQVDVPMDNYDFPGFRLTLEDGTVYVITREDLGDRVAELEPGKFVWPHAYNKPMVSQIIQPDGSQIQISGDKITKVTSNGVQTSAVAFHRDSVGRIDFVYDPSSLDANDQPIGQAAVQYTYDNMGNLSQVSRLVDKVAGTYDTTTFVYTNTVFPHYITQIIDPRGIPIGQTLYYSDPSDAANYGKIMSITDAKGRVTSFLHKTSGFATGKPTGYGTSVAREEITFTPVSGVSQLTVHEADERGNVICSIDAMGFTNWFKYGPRDGSTPTDPPDPQVPWVLLQQQHTVTEQQNGTSVTRTYLSGSEYKGSGTAAQELAPTAVTNTFAQGQTTNFRVTRYEYNGFGQVTKTYEPRFSGNVAAGIYHETQYNSAGQPTAEIYHGSDPAPDSGTAQTLSTSVYYTAADGNGNLAGQLHYILDARNVATVYEYYTGEAGGRLGDLKSVTVRSPGYTGAPLSKTGYTYDLTGNRLTEERVKFQRDGSGTVIVDGNGVPSETGRLISQYGYDAKYRVTKVTDPSGATSETTYDSLGHVATTTDRYGATTTHYYDRTGNSSGTAYPDGTVAYQAAYYGNEGTGLLRYQVAEDRHFASDTGPATGTRTTYDAVGRAIRSERVNNLVIKHTINNNGEVCDTAYDSTQPCTVLTTTSTTCLLDGRVLQTTAENNSVTTYEYSGDSLQKVTIPPPVSDAISGDTITTQIIEFYDLSGNVVTNQTESFPNGSSTADAHRPVTRYTYDQLDRRTQTRVYADETIGASAGVMMESNRYDWVDRAWLQIDANNHAKAFIYDDAGNLSWVVTDVDPTTTAPPDPTSSNWPRQADSTVTHYEYNELGQQTHQIDGNSHDTQFTYDDFGRRTKRTLPDTQFETWDYDYQQSGDSPSAGKRLNKVRHTDFNGHQMIMAYDAMGRLLQKKSASSTLAQYEYTATGQRSRMTDNMNNPGVSSRETRYAYDEQNRLRIKSAPEGTVGYGYDTVGRLQSITTQKSYTFPSGPPYDFTTINNTGASSNPNGASMTYTYDARNRLATVNLDNSGTADAAYSYDAVGNQAKMTYRNAVQSAYTYNARDQLTVLSTTRGGSPVASFTYDDSSWASQLRLSNSGLRRQVQETVNGTSRTVTNGYDHLNRLTSESLLSGPNTGSISYDAAAGYSDATGYDPVGNRRQRTVTLSPAVSGYSSASYAPYDVDDRLGAIQSGKIGATFDANGNTRQFDLNGDGVADASALDLYDLENRLTNATRTVGTISMVYDGDGNRVSKTVSGTTTYYVVDDGNPSGYSQVLEERTSLSGAPTVTYVYGLSRISQQRGGTVSCYGYDGLGTVRYLTGASGSITDTYTYDAFGALLGSSESTVNWYRYAGEQYDPDLQFYYLRARYYKPELGRFWTTDTYEGNNEDPISLHKYLYAAADPVNSTDPAGMFTQKLGYLAEAAIREVYMDDHPGDDVLPGKWTKLGGPLNPAYRLKPDIFNRSTHKWADVKPLSTSGLVDAGLTYALYLGAFTPFGYGPDTAWSPSTHYAVAGVQPIFFFNAGGIVFYTDPIDNVEDALAATSIQAAKLFFLKNRAKLIRGLQPALERIGVLAVEGEAAEGADVQTGWNVASLISLLLGF